MKYLRPRLPEKEIELCLDLFDKEEAKKRILEYIKGVFDDAESQLKNCFIPCYTLADLTDKTTNEAQIAKGDTIEMIACYNDLEEHEL